MSIKDIKLTAFDILEVGDRFYDLLVDVEITEDSKKTYAYAQHIVDTMLGMRESDRVMQKLLDNDFIYDGFDYKKEYLDNDINEPFEFDCEGATALFFADNFEFLAKQVKAGF